MCVPKLGNVLFIFLALLLEYKVIAQNLHPLEDLLVISTTSSIRTFDTSGKELKVIAKTGGNSIDYDCSSGELFWLDTDKQETNVLLPGNSKPKQALKAKNKNWIPISIAVDSVTHKLYIADKGSATVNLYDLNSGKFMVIVNSNNLNIVGLAIDLQEGYLFIQSTYHIIRTDLDGTNRKTIYALGDATWTTDSKILLISKITADPQTKRLYWMDTSTNEIVSVNYQGCDRKIHFRTVVKSSISESNHLLGSITVLSNFLYWTDGVKQTYKINLSSENKIQRIILSVHGQFIKAVNCSKQKKIPNPCANNNGFCQDLCILAKNSPNNFRCTCRTGYQLADDNKSCIPVEEFIIFPANERLRGLSITNSNKPSVDVIDPTAFDVQYTSSIETNVKDGVVYHTGHPQFEFCTQINQVWLGNGKQKIMNPQPLSNYVSQLAYDWGSRNLYYFSEHPADPKSLNVVNVDNPSLKKIVIPTVEGDFMLNKFIVHPNKGYLYFLEIFDEISRIVVAGLDGSNANVIYEVSNTFIRTLTLDYEMDRLYWFERSMKHDSQSQIQKVIQSGIRHSNLIGGDIKSIQITDKYKDAYSMIIYGNHIFMVVEDYKVIKFDKFGTSKSVEILADFMSFGAVNKLSVFSKKSQIPISKHPCANGHQCQQFCFTVPTKTGGIKGICGCSYGYRLAANRKSCVKIYG